jgi:DNA-binding NtrC family response regulator
VARVDTPVLIEGETGTGKELVAQAIHFASHRQGGPFIAVNCAGLTESLLASQLFGHKRGAFTGAVADHQGLFAAANGGTLFLDEIGDIPLSVQTNLLRVLQEREITRLGEAIPRKIDVRIVAATHQNLQAAVSHGTFRSDLLYRIRVARISLPALRQRRSDIPLLVSSFLVYCRAAIGKPVQDVSHSAMRLLLQYHWPGNVRELKSAIEFAVIRCRGTVLKADDLPPELSEPAPLLKTFSTAAVDEPQRIVAALQQAQGNRTLAARLLGMSRATFYRRLANLDLPVDC